MAHFQKENKTFLYTKPYIKELYKDSVEFF